MENQRIWEIGEAAARLFLQRGYSRTQISDIAGAVGVSVGTIYHDFAGKKEILYFVLKRTVDPAFVDRTFIRPITDELFEGLDEELNEAFDRSAAYFAKNLSRKEYHFKELISDTFDLLSQYAVGCLFLERNRFEFPDLAERYRTYRLRFFETMTRYLVRFIGEGEVRPLEQVELTTRLIIELLTWWTMDVRYLTFDGPDIAPETAKKLCMDHLMTAYGC